MIIVAVLLGVMAVSLYLASYGLWAWRNNYRRGAVGTFMITVVTLLLPVAVWLYHGSRS